MQRVLRFIFCLIILFVGTATTAQAGFLYVLRNDAAGNQIYGFAVSETTGAPALLPGFPISTGGTGGTAFAINDLAIDRKNGRLYAINEGTDTFSAYSIDPATGALTSLPFSPRGLGSTGIWIMASVHPSGSPLLIGDLQGRVNSYAVTATTATLVQGLFQIDASPEGFVFSRDGNFFYGGGGERFAGLSVNSMTGILTPLSGSPYIVGGGPVGYSMDAQERLFLVEYGTARLRAFQTTNGIPTPVAGNPFGNGISNCVQSVLHPNGNYLFIVCRGQGGQVGSYLISGTGTSTTLSNVTESPFPTGGTSPNALEISHNGKFLWAANATSRNLTTYSANESTGVLTNIAIQPVNTFGTTGFVTGMDYIPLVSISGRLLTAGGRGVFGASISLTDLSGNTRIARSNGSGYFRVAGVLAGETYTLSVRHKQFSFTQQDITVTDKLSDLILTAEQ